MYAYCLQAKIKFPAGLTPGDGTDGHSAILARDGCGRPVLRGTAVAGVLRSTYANCDVTEEQVRWLFGADLGDDDSMLTPSRLQVADCLIDLGKSSQVMRTHNQINRHTGTALDGSLFDIPRLPPGSTTDIILWLRDDDEDQLDRAMQKIANCLAGDLVFGGKSARGAGRAQCIGDIHLWKFDLRDVDEHAAYLDLHRSWRANSKLETNGAATVVTESASDNSFHLDITFQIPRGQDILIASGEKTDKMLILTTSHADGVEHVVLPGSSLRGVMRAWMNRLAVKEGKQVSDSAKNYTAAIEAGATLNGDLVNGLYTTFKDKGRAQALKTRHDADPVAGLFGSLAARGRIHIEDAYLPLKNAHKQNRAHVAIDRITGGAAEGMLFQNEVITYPAQFPVHIKIVAAQDSEIRWLAQTITAIHLGLIRIGSSKAAGRLEVKTFKAMGAGAEHFTLPIQQIKGD